MEENKADRLLKVAEELPKHIELPQGIGMMIKPIMEVSKANLPNMMQQLTDEDVDNLLCKAKMFINYIEYGEIEGNNGNNTEECDSMEYINDDIL